MFYWDWKYLLERAGMTRDTPVSCPSLSFQGCTRGPGRGTDVSGLWSERSACAHSVVTDSDSVWLPDCSPPGFSVHGTLKARILEWVATSSSRGSSRPRGQSCIFCIGRQILYHLSHLGSPYRPYWVGRTYTWDTVRASGRARRNQAWDCTAQGPSISESAC